LPLNKEFNLGLGNFNFTKISLEEVEYSNSERKGYFMEGGAPRGAYWMDSKTRVNFLNSTMEWEFVNSTGPSAVCYSKDRFLELSGRNEEDFKNFDEVCVSR